MSLIEKKQTQKNNNNNNNNNSTEYKKQTKGEIYVFYLSSFLQTVFEPKQYSSYNILICRDYICTYTRGSVESNPERFK